VRPASRCRDRSWRTAALARGDAGHRAAGQHGESHCNGRGERVASRSRSRCQRGAGNGWPNLRGRYRSIGPGIHCAR
jgi:hypothetical protein